MFVDPQNSRGIDKFHWESDLESIKLSTLKKAINLVPRVYRLPTQERAGEKGLDRHPYRIPYKKPSSLFCKDKVIRVKMYGVLLKEKCTELVRVGKMFSLAFRKYIALRMARP